MYFMRRKDVDFIVGTLFISPRVIRREIHCIRSRILREIGKLKYFEPDFQCSSEIC